MKGLGDILRVERLTMRFGGLTAIDNVSLNARRGDITAIIGPNGAGKTTLFNCITGFYKPSEGRIALAKTDTSAFEFLDSVTASGGRFDSKRRGLYLLERMQGFDIARSAGVGRTFQNIRLFPRMTVLENMLVAQHNVILRTTGLPFGALLGLSRFRIAEAAGIEFAASWLNEAGLLARANDPAGVLAYGLQRKLEIVRAMCARPVLLCLDEPAAGLNPKESAALNELLLKIKTVHGTSILLIEHDMGVVMGVSDRIHVLDYGRKIAEGTPGEIRTNPKVIAAYLGVDDGDAGGFADAQARG